MKIFKIYAFLERFNFFGYKRNIYHPKDLANVLYETCALVQEKTYVKLVTHTENGNTSHDNPYFRNSIIILGSVVQQTVQGSIELIPFHQLGPLGGGGGGGRLSKSKLFRAHWSRELVSPVCGIFHCLIDLLDRSHGEPM